MVDSKFLFQGSFARKVLPTLTLLLIVSSHYVIFAIVPTEQVMGLAQRIFYFHVGAAMTSYFAIAVLLISSLFYLATKKWQWDALAETAAEVSLVFCTIVLATGVIWGHSAWNTWWRWEPRLVSFLILWLMMLSYVLLRAFTKRDDRQANYAAVLGILAAVNIPIVIFSVKLIEHTEQLHPQIVANQGLRDVRFVYGLILANITLIVLSIWLLAVRLGNSVLQREVTILQREQQFVLKIREAGL